MPAEAPWQRKLEFDTDKMDDDNKILTARCRWRRKAHVLAECKVRDDCVGNL